MAGNVQGDTTDKIRAQMLSQAHTRAAAVLAARTALTTSDARGVAPAVVEAVTSSIRAEYAQQLASITGEQATKLGLAALGVLALDLTMFATIAARGPRWARPVAAVAIAAHTTFFFVNKHRVEKVRAAARAETARGNIRAAA